ncbi:DUF6396 domain-containing protein [Chromobacterium sp. Beijing]|uniref:SEL1-like repeat protein n=1 Tax=Chromobacterium sp. Beijing TaxID=2735795 RepID=UPI001F1DFF36|nr:DUF6396 domain-containing protein [Chromobacterium sp. Beijing]UJB30656.1 sel1 repeat family protein [Chromobacterium sp. Beijing]
MRRLLPLALLTLALTACKETRMLPDAGNIDTKLAFSCRYEADASPAPEPELQQIFEYARFMQKNNLLDPQTSANVEIARLYRIAAAHGHVKANYNLQNGLRRGDFDGSVIEVLDLNDQLIAAQIPAGYYLLGVYVNSGFGYSANDELALRYFRKAADLGNPQAQYYVGDKLVMGFIGQREIQKIGLQMKRCAAEQGHAKAAGEAGTWAKGEDNTQALKYYQLAVKAGNDVSAYKLSKAFLAPSSGSFDDLGLAYDAERSRRYDILSDILGDWSYRQPTVPDIDDIVPLPPAPLPEWDGKIQWLRDHEAGFAPLAPSEERLRALAEAKLLDPATGLPDEARRARIAADKQAAADEARRRAERTPPFADALPLFSRRQTGDVPNVAAHWRPLAPKGCVPWAGEHPTTLCFAGQPLPQLNVAYPLPWWKQWFGDAWLVYRPVAVEWELVRYHLPA